MRCSPSDTPDPTGAIPASGDAVPRVSILIPNYNNGRASSVGGRCDLLGDLLASLLETLADDPTGLEIIACDDGSTDDSLATLRDWAGREWPAGTPRGGRRFLTLIERPHRGVLSAVANELVAASSGDILVRLDGDIVVHTPCWASMLREHFDGPPLGIAADQLGAVGPLQLGVDGRVHSFGDAILHPKGYHHVGAGLDPACLSEAREVDHVMGCFYCCRRSVHDRLGGFDESILRGQTIDFGLRVRRAGYRCIATPRIVFTHRHGLRAHRATEADQREGVARTLRVFREKWGFDRIAPDTGVLRERYGGAGSMLWDDGRFERPWPDRPESDATLQGSQWVAYTQDHVVRTAVDARLRAMAQLVTEMRDACRLAVVGCGSGLIVHLLAQATPRLTGQGGAVREMRVVGIDAVAGRLAVARQCTARQSYLGVEVAFEHQGEADRLPLDEGSMDAVVLLDQLSSHPAPIRLLRAARRATREAGYLLVVDASVGDLSEEDRLGPAADRAFDPFNLRALIQAEENWKVATHPLPGVNDGGPLVLGAVRGPGLGAEAAEAGDVGDAGEQGDAARSAA